MWLVKGLIVMIDGVSDSMREFTQSKFDLWDKMCVEGWLENPERAGQVYSFLNDPSVYFYAFFKNEKGEPFKVFPYQDIILNDNNKRIIFAAANQVGKSITLCIKALHFALNNPGKTVVMFSKTLPQSKDLLRQIKDFLRNCNLDYKSVVGDSDNKTEIYFKHYNNKGKSLKQSRILCIPATEGGLGFPVDLLLIDELAFYDDGEYFYYQIAQPRTYFTKGQIIVFSNPAGQTGVFWRLWNDSDFSQYRFNFLDCPMNSLEEYEKLRLKLTAERFDSTVNAIFTSPEGGFLSLDERKRIQSIDLPNSLPTVLTTPVYIFFDWAKTVDRTVRVIGVPVFEEGSWADKIKVLEMKEYPQNTPYNEIIDVDLKNLIHSLGIQNVAMVGWDNTGVGKGLEDFVNRVQQFGISTMPVEFSLKNKSRIYTLFKLLVEQNRIVMPFVDVCDRQLAALRFKRVDGNTLKVHHENERDRDDFPDALAGLCSLIISPENAPVTCEII
jgi:hypothetical protein